MPVICDFPQANAKAGSAAARELGRAVLRNIVISAEEPEEGECADGDIWIVYREDDTQ